MASGNTNFGNDAGTGTVGADGFLGPVTGAVTATTVIATTSITDRGMLFYPPTTYAAAGATQGTATLIGTVTTVLVTATTSAQGIKLPVAATGRMLFLGTTGTKAPKLYPNTNGTIGTGSTNTATQLSANTGYVLNAKDTTHWYFV